MQTCLEDDLWEKVRNLTWSGMDCRFSVCLREGWSPFLLRREEETMLTGNLREREGVDNPGFVQIWLKVAVRSQLMRPWKTSSQAHSSWSSSKQSLQASNKSAYMPLDLPVSHITQEKIFKTYLCVPFPWATFIPFLYICQSNLGGPRILTKMEWAVLEWRCKRQGGKRLFWNTRSQLQTQIKLPHLPSNLHKPISWIMLSIWSHN